MKFIQFVIFILLFTVSFLFLFNEIELHFIFFHILLILMFFFPYYFWTESVFKAMIILALLTVLICAGVYFFKYSPVKKMNLVPQYSLNIEPQIKTIDFEWGKNTYSYSFQMQELKDKNKGDVFSLDKFVWLHNKLNQYKKYVSQFMSKITVAKLDLNFIFICLWIYSVVLISFIFSYSKSLIVSYSNILFVIPYTFFMGDFFFLKPFAPMLLYGQIVFIGILTVIAVYRVKN